MAQPAPLTAVFQAKPKLASFVKHAESLGFKEAAFFKFETSKDGVFVYARPADGLLLVLDTHHSELNSHKLCFQIPNWPDFSSGAMVETADGRLVWQGETGGNGLQSEQLLSRDIARIEKAGKIEPFSLLDPDTRTLGNCLIKNADHNDQRASHGLNGSNDPDNKQTYQHIDALQLKRLAAMPDWFKTLVGVPTGYTPASPTAPAPAAP